MAAAIFLAVLPAVGASPSVQPAAVSAAAPAACSQAQCDQLALAPNHGKIGFFCDRTAPYACLGTGQPTFGGCNESASFWTQQNCGGPACDTTVCAWNANAAHGNPPAATRTLQLQNSCPFEVVAGYTGGAFSFADKSQLSCASQSCPSGLACNPNNSQCYWKFPGNQVVFPLEAAGQTGSSVNIQLTNDVIGDKAATGEQYIKWSGKVWAATGCDSKNQNCQTAFCPTGGCTAFSGPNGPVTLAEFTLVNNAQDFYDISVINGVNVPIEMTPASGQHFTLAPAGAAADYYCASAGGSQPAASNLTDCSWSLDTKVGGVDQANLLRMVHPAAAQPQPCSASSPCQSPAVCGLSAADNGTVAMVCGAQIGWWTADEICAFTGGKGKIGPLDCTASVGTGATVADLFGCSDGTVFHNSCYSTSGTGCCGCEDWPYPTTQKCDGSNQDWVNQALPWIKPFKEACPTAYSYPYDDKTSTFTCRSNGTGSGGNHVNYTITFCPGGKTGL